MHPSFAIIGAGSVGQATAADLVSHGYKGVTLCDIDEEIVEHLTSGLLVSLCNAQPGLYPRSRWTGADVALDNLGLMECVHKLLSTTYFRFAASFVKGAARRQLLNCGLRAADYSPQGMDAIADLDDVAGGEDSAQAGRCSV